MAAVGADDRQIPAADDGRQSWGFLCGKGGDKK
jgi:hypothetical protein